MADQQDADNDRDALESAIAALVAALVADFALTATAIRALAHALYSSGVDALIAAYADAATAVGVSPTIADAYTPPDAVLTQLAADAHSTADGIAATYADDLTREATAIANAYADANGGALGATAVAKQAVARSLNEYAAERAATRAPILADYECGLAQHQGTRAFVQDALAAQDNPSDNPGDSPLLDSTGAPIDLSDAVLAVLPDSSSVDECADYAGETFPLDAFDDLPAFPAHLNCQHAIYVLLANGDEWEEDE
jgi:hypothetical protein